jgi:recombination protein RecA
MGDSRDFMPFNVSGIKKLTGTISKTNCTVFFINQLRENWVMFGNPETTTGG